MSTPLNVIVPDKRVLSQSWNICILVGSYSSIALRNLSNAQSASLSAAFAYTNLAFFVPASNAMSGAYPWMAMRVDFRGFSLVCASSLPSIVLFSFAL